jgi:apolipoprotein N-acyltransferase
VPWRWFTWPRLAALAAGGLPALTFPEPSLWWLAYVCLVPLLLVIRSAPHRREAILRGWWGGAGFILAVHHWLAPNLHVFLIVVAVAIGALWAPWGWLVWRLLGPGRHLGAALALLPASWLAIELVRSVQYFGGPWGLLGASQWQVRPALALASLGGVWLVSVVVVAINVAIAAAIVAPSARQPALASVVGLVALALGWWALAPSPTSSGEIARIAVVQPGVVHNPSARFAYGERLTRSLLGKDLDLVVWGESSVGFDLTARPDLRGRLEVLVAEIGAPLLVNVDARRAGGGGIFKSSVLIDPGTPDLARYDKMRLVPFGEYVPFRFLLGWLLGSTEAAHEDRRRGAALALLNARGLRVGPLICFESAFPDMSRRLAARGADILVVQSSTSTFQQSWAPAQHASLAALRAAETGRPVVHATLSGVSAIYDATGRRLGSLSTTERSTLVADVPLVTGHSLYTRLGDWVPALAVALLAGAAGQAIITQRRRPVATPTSERTLRSMRRRRHDQDRDETSSRMTMTLGTPRPYARAPSALCRLSDP